MKKEIRKYIKKHDLKFLCNGITPRKIYAKSLMGESLNLDEKLASYNQKLKEFDAMDSHKVRLTMNFIFDELIKNTENITRIV